ncbi:hypothetical protein ACVR0S_00520 [Streptococcus dentapri]|uniref:6-phospho-beta-glucosidase n=1 Tax=Streptococcus dentapri TaxID=573564 RepID=A0ABV8CZM6_9STRE
MAANQIGGGYLEGVDLMGYTLWGWMDLVFASTGEIKTLWFSYVDKDMMGRVVLNTALKNLLSVSKSHCTNEED